MEIIEPACKNHSLEEKANCFNRLYFGWISQILKEGAAKPLECFLNFKYL